MLAKSALVSFSAMNLSELGQQFKASRGQRQIQAIEEIAKVGSGEAGELLHGALNHKDGFVRLCARNAVRDSVQREKASEGFKLAVFDGVAGALWDDTLRSLDCTNVIELLPLLDPARAIQVLTSPALLRIDYPELRTLLKILTNLSVRLEDRVFEWLPIIRPKTMGDSITGADGLIYAQLLRAAGVARRPELENWIADALVLHCPASGWSIEEAAAEAKCIARGLSPTLFADMEKWRDEIGFDALPLPVRHFLTALDLVSIWEGTGLVEYLTTISDVIPGPTPPSVRATAECALDGLKAMGEGLYSSILERALELCGPDGPPLNEGERYKFFDDEEGGVAEQIRAIPSPEGVEYQSVAMLGYLYAAAHAPAFLEYYRKQS